MELSAESGDDWIDLDSIDVTDLAVLQANRRIRSAAGANDQDVLELSGAEDLVRRTVEGFLLVRRQHRLVAAFVDVQRPTMAVVGRGQADLVVGRPPVPLADVPG